MKQEDFVLYPYHEEVQEGWHFVNEDAGRTAKKTHFLEGSEL